MRKYLFIILATSVAISSCDKKLNLLPQQSVAEEVALSSDANVKKVLNGCYDALSNGDLYGGDFQLYSELLAANGEIRWEGTFNQPREIWLKSIITTNSYVRDTWLSGYNTVNIANNILSAIDVVNSADQNRVKGEALLMRGMIYFELVRLYAKPYNVGASSPGIPIVLTPTRGIDAASYVPRSTVGETYTQVLADMTEAESLLPNTNGVFLNKAAAAAMLARVYLQMGNFAEARDAANRAITIATGNGKSLTTTYGEAFNNSTNSSEDIFAIQVSDQDGANDMQLFWSIPAYGGRDGDVSIQASHLALYNPADARLALFYTGAGAVRSGKWKLQYKNLPIIRLAEMYLTRAECNQRLGTSVGNTPASDLTLIRGRVGLLPIAAPTLANILAERKLELAHEGLAVHDLKRLQGTADGYAYNANEMVFPIPQREIDAAKGTLAQNDGY